MVVLAAAVIAATGVLVLRTSAPEPVSAERHLRKLADLDGDVKREGEAALRRMGPAALAPLREAAKSSDRLLASRAANLLLELQPLPATPTLDAVSEDLKFTLVCSGHQDKPSRFGIFWVEVTNLRKEPVSLVLAGIDASWHPAWFEVEDEGGSVQKVPAYSIASHGAEISVTVLPPGAKAMLFTGGVPMLEAAMNPYSRFVRFVYDGADPEYRKRGASVGEGSLLPEKRHSSKKLPLAEAN